MLDSTELDPDRHVHRLVILSCHLQCRKLALSSMQLEPKTNNSITYKQTQSAKQYLWERHRKSNEWPCSPPPRTFSKRVPVGLIHSILEIVGVWSNTLLLACFQVHRLDLDDAPL